VLRAMRCPECGGEMLRDQPQVTCVNGHGVPVVEGYLDATGARAVASAATAKTFESFGYEWTTFSSVMEEDELYAEHYLRDLDLPGPVGRLGLDAGCGRGRYSRFLAPHLAQLVALDGSDAVRSPAEIMRDLKNAAVRRRKFRLRGVLWRSASPGGSAGGIRPPGAAARARRCDDAVPLQPARSPRVARDRSVCCRLATPLHSADVPSRPARHLLSAGRTLVAGRRPTRKGGRRCSRGELSSLPMGTYRDKPLRSLVLDTFDRLSAPVEHRYVWADLAPWFEESGLVVDAHRDESGWLIVSHRPDG
jgi:hypothetical protein